MENVPALTPLTWAFDASVTRTRHSSDTVPGTCHAYDPDAASIPDATGFQEAALSVEYSMSTCCTWLPVQRMSCVVSSFHCSPPTGEFTSMKDSM